MKRFHFLLTLVLMLGIGSVALAEMPKEKKVVKVEVSTSTIQLVAIDAAAEAIKVELSNVYIAEPTGEEISYFHPPTLIGKINSAYLTSINKPPAINKTDFLPDVIRLSCTSLVAASNIHV